MKILVIGTNRIRPSDWKVKKACVAWYPRAELRRGQRIAIHAL